MDEREEGCENPQHGREHSKTKQEGAHAGLPENQRIQGWIRIAYRRLRDGKKSRRARRRRRNMLIRMLLVIILIIVAVGA